MSKILLVEDNEMNIDILRRRLCSKGFEIIAAMNGLEALEKAKTESPDLILMDLSLPKLDGWEATRRLKKDNDTQNIPVIVLTAHVLKSDREKAMAAGCDDYDVKPIDFSRLLDKIKKQLGKT